MVKIGYNTEKFTLINEISKTLEYYFLRFYRGTKIYPKLQLEVLNSGEIKIINSISNISSPSAQKRYKLLMTDIFKFILPPKTYIVIIKDGNAYLRITKDSINEKYIIDLFKEMLPLMKTKKLKYKTIYTLYNDNDSVIYINKLKDHLLKILKINNESDKVINTSTDMLID